MSSSPYTTFGAPPDGVAWAALVAAGALLCVLHAPTRNALGLGTAGKWLVPVLALSATLLSAGYVAYYLRFGPRIIDATSYYLEARGMAHGYFAFPVPSPSGSFRGRFLIANAAHGLSVIFPPGYPALLALGFLAHAPLAVGPVLAGLLVLCTYALAKQITGREDIARVAAALSLLCAALRYHTADTMSHGLCALLLCASLFTAFRARRWDALLSGLACGWLTATRPVTGAVGALLALSVLARDPRRLPTFAIGLVPGLTLLILYQHSATGSYLASTQLSYYALADGPPGCFRYGFGQGIGCLFEHGDYVRARLQHGYGVREAAGVTVRRLAIHCIDIANAAPLALLCPIGAWLGRRERGARTLFFGSLLVMLAYAPFYFDGSYPGGGARLFADVLPLEHVLLAIALVRLEWTWVALPLSLVGFAVHASFSHRSLAERDGGKPMFEANVFARDGVGHGLVFVDTDHGFNLGHEPGQLDAEHHIVVARYHGDAHDRLLWVHLNRPQSYRLTFALDTAQAPLDLLPYAPEGEAAQRWRAAAEWPPLAVTGWAEPAYSGCSGGQPGLRLHSVGPGAGVGLELELAAPDTESHPIRIRWQREPGPETVLRLSGAGFECSARIAAGPAECLLADLCSTVLSDQPRPVRFQASRPGLLDYVEVLP
ncbi:MAG TPA: hypothetical protein VNW92_19450 [Polyangiaceae bacterium]|nr:hypothetical protein [Polyangiaceae bacterium]